MPVTGPLKTWYDLHEALAHEVRALADLATQGSSDDLDDFARRFGVFDAELRHHSEVEDGIMFPAIVAAGGTVPEHLRGEHRDEQLQAYAVGAAVMAAKGRGGDTWAALAGLTATLRDGLLHHLKAEEDEVLDEVDRLFDPEEQAAFLRTIIGAMPPDPHMQPWVAAALTPEHLEARLRNMQESLGHGALVGVMAQIHAGVDDDTWAEVKARTPDLAALAEGE